EAAAVAALHEPYPAIVRQDLGPALHVACGLEDALKRCTDQDSIDSVHSRSVDRAVARRHAASGCQLQDVSLAPLARWTKDRLRRGVCQLHWALTSGDQDATIRNPGRWRATARTPASRSRPANSSRVYPRLSDRTASCRVTRSIPKPMHAAHTPAIATR